VEKLCGITGKEDCGGILTSPGEFPAVCYLVTSDAFCSATLVSPTMVVTANHCITHGRGGADCFVAEGEGIDTKENEDMDVYCVSDVRAGVDTVPLRYHGIHTFAKSGPVIVRVKRQIDGCSNDDSPRDVALIPLDNRIRMSDVLPLHTPAQGAPICGDIVDDDDDFVGQVVGFGKMGNVVFTGDYPNIRNSLPSEDWDREDVGSGFIYQNRWNIFFDVANYGGPLGGDSGGALVTLDVFNDPSIGNAHKIFCGVTSRYYALPPIEVGCDEADIADAATSQMLTDHLFTPAGQIKGECNKVTLLDGPDRDKDTDGDRIPDACDPCPKLFDADYNDLPTPDTDGDGIPDRCDACPTGHDPPEVKPPPDVTLATCDVPSSTVIGTAIVNDFCATNGSIASVINNAPSKFPVGTTIVTWTGISATTGLSGTATQKVTVEGRPLITPPADVTLHACGPGEIGTATAIDDCTTTPPTITKNVSSFGLGTTIVTWTAKSALTGLTSTATQQVTVFDDAPPLVTAPADLLLADCSVSNVDPGTPTVLDQCDGTSALSRVTITRWVQSLNGTTVNQQLPAGPHVFEPGGTIIRYEIIDSHGAMVSVTQRVTVGTPPRGAWAANVAYRTGDRVTYLGRVWECIQGHTSLATWTPDVATAQWQIPTPCGALAWQLRTYYTVGARVLYSSHTFSCITAHTSTVGWEPGPATASLWSQIN